MPSSQRKKRSTLFDKSPKMLGEVTLDDFANSPAPKGGRIRKAVTTDLIKAHIDDTLEEPVDDEVEPVRVGRRRRRRQSTGSSTSQEDIDSRPGRIYPLDLWYLLSEYIRPQDVLTFSLLCKASYHVTNTSKFWTNLHKRYCKADRVPKKFGRECLEKRHGLKSTVVKALFLSCPTLGHPTTHDPTVLSGSLCVLMWIERTGLGDIQEDSVTVNSGGRKWIYKFKLTRQNYLLTSSLLDKRVKTCDIKYNPDHGCKILTVPCLEYTAIPCVSGMRLCDVKYKYKSKQLNLVFSSAPLNSSSSQMGNISIRLHLSTGPTVLDWWHPSYHISTSA